MFPILITFHIVSLLYQLVLVDEPELSYHLMWQMQYLNNIKAVQNMRNCAFLIATHSTQVFEGKFHWDKPLNHTHIGSIGNLCNDRIAALMENVLEGFAFERVLNAEKQLLK